MTTILEGKTLSSQISSSLKPRIEKLIQNYNRPPHLSAIAYKEDEASVVYLKKEIAACEKIGITADMSYIDSSTGTGRLISIVEELSVSPKTDAVLITRPLPKNIEAMDIWDNINPVKDIDGVSTINLGRMFQCRNFTEIAGNSFFIPCTALAVIRLLQYHNIDVKGKNVSVLGRSPTVGKPTAHLLSSLDATVTLCHSKTQNLAEMLGASDMVVSAIGKPKFITADMVKQGSILIDVGTNWDENGKMCGDIDFENVKSKVSAISPVPGGVGPVTLACLLENIVLSAERMRKV
jgi:methylenetetrahydrofolate dehydrogenase (NADP+) / methenyltetrahydrofolate cyclohydrolase